jgi:uncharacterized protein YndB with AHSA1/START domain
MQARDEGTSSTTDREIVTTRVFDAPPEMVWEAWASPTLLAKWWGPRGFTTTTSAFDLRPGGSWVHTMHGPDGRDYPHRLVFEEVVRPERIAWIHHGGVDGMPIEFRHSVTFTRRGSKTELTLRAVFATAAERNANAEKYGAVEGARQTLERLAELLTHPGRPELRMTRLFDAPRRLVYEAWTRPEYVSRWFAPAPLTIPRCEVDLRSGGVFRLAMKTPDGIEFPMDAHFVEVVPEERIVFAGTIHGGNDVTTTVTFRDEGSKTRLDVLQTFAFESEATRGAQQGWTATLNQLGEHVAAASPRADRAKDSPCSDAPHQGSAPSLR